MRKQNGYLTGAPVNPIIFKTMQENARAVSLAEKAGWKALIEMSEIRMRTLPASARGKHADF